MKITKCFALVGGLAAAFFALPAVANHEVHPAPVIPAIPATAEIPGNVQADLFAKGYHVSEIEPGSGVYWITDGNYHSMAITTPAGIVLIDAPEPLPFFGPMPVLAALDEIRVLAGMPANKKVTHLIYSHGHSDHIGGAGVIKAANPGLKIIAHEETKANLERANDPKRPVPTRTFSDTLNLKFAKTSVELSYHGNTHQEGNTFIYLPDSKILMVVDIVYPGWVPFRRLALSNDIAGWIGGHDAVLSFDFDTLVGGHLTRLGDRDDALLAKEYVQDIQDHIEDVILEAGALFGAIGLIDAEHGGGFAFSTVAKWALFSAFYDVSSQSCATLLDAKYRSDLGPDLSKHLGGAETFNFSNCEAYFVARRLGTHE